MVVYFVGKGVGLGMEQRIIDEVKFVDGYEGLYLIDNLGNVISVPKIEGRYIRNKYNILATKVNKYGYVEVTLVKDSKMKTHLLHRLIAKAFVPNPNNYDVVYHKNGIKNDNRIENLEWCTVSQNTKHAYNNNLNDSQIKALGALAKVNEQNMYVKVVLSKDGEEISFKSTREAAEFLNTKKDEITRAIRKGQRHKGYYVYGEKPTIANGEA